MPSWVCAACDSDYEIISLSLALPKSFFISFSSLVLLRGRSERLTGWAAGSCQGQHITNRHTVTTIWILHGLLHLKYWKQAFWNYSFMKKKVSECILQGTTQSWDHKTNKFDFPPWLLIREREMHRPLSVLWESPWKKRKWMKCKTF